MEEEEIELSEEELKEIKEKVHGDESREFSSSIKKITYKLDLLCYFVKNMRSTLDVKPEEFGGFVCSGIVPILVDWIEHDFMKDDVNGEEEEPKFTLKQYEDAAAVIADDVEKQMYR